jgi:CHAD domain-containing protein
VARGSRTETELKYEVLVEGAADVYLTAPQIGAFTAEGRVRSATIEDRYVDTPDWALARAGYAARLRRAERRTRIELKSAGSGGGRFHRREELDGPADQNAPPSAWPDSPVRSAVVALCGDAPLAETVTIRQTRRKRRMWAQDGAAEPTQAELSLDEVEVLVAGKAVDGWSELEVELTAGPEKPLRNLADVFDAADGLRRGRESKLERAARLIREGLPSLPETVRERWQGAPAQLPARKRGEPKPAASTAVDSAAAGEDTSETPAEPAPSGPRNLGILADDSLPEAACKVLAYHFGRLKAKEKGTRRGSNPEDLHEMRVAVRRMRAAWRVFDEAFKGGSTRRLRQRLRGLSDRLGVVRDLDVLIEDLESYRAGLDEADRPGLDPLLTLWRRQRESAHQQLVAELDSERHARLMADMKEFLDAGANEVATVASPTLPHRVRDRSPSQIWAAYESVRAYDPVLPWADVETLHRLRIAGKWLRYDLEFFGEALGSDSARLMERVVALQDFLGRLHDADVAAKLTRDVLVARAGELSRLETDTIGAYLHSREREVARRKRALGPVWRAVVGAPFRRALGRATAAL